MSLFSLVAMVLHRDSLDVFSPQKTHFFNTLVSTLKDTCFAQEKGELHHKYQEKAPSSCFVYLRSELHPCKHITAYLNMQHKRAIHH